MFTNLEHHGGNFSSVLNSEFSSATGVTIASGYTSTEIIDVYTPDFLRIASNGGTSRLLLGMAFYEGLSEKKYKTIMELNSRLKSLTSNAGVYVCNGRRYHGKVYYFEKNLVSNVYVGSSNFSISGTRTNIECTIPIIVAKQKTEIIDFLTDLYSSDFSVNIDRVDNIVSSRKKAKTSTVENKWNELSRYDPSKISKDELPKFSFDISRVIDKEQSNLNIYFGKGRWNRKTGKIKARPWYEVELIADRQINSHPNYPKGDFLAYTDDGYIIPMRTQGDYHKNIRSRNSLQIFGIWLKGKLENSGSLKRYQLITKDTLIEYGNDKIDFYKIEEGKYYIEF